MKTKLATLMALALMGAVVINGGTTPNFYVSSSRPYPARP
jgi:hypothetical protein